MTWIARFDRQKLTTLLAAAALAVLGTPALAQPAAAYKIIDLGGLPGAVRCAANGINNAGEVVGRCRVLDPSSGSYNDHAFYWKDRNGNGVSDPGEMIDLGVLDGSSSEAFAINDAGQVVGVSDILGGGSWWGGFRRHGFLWRDANANGVSDPGEMQDLGRLPSVLGCGYNPDDSQALAINSSGTILGLDSRCEFVGGPAAWTQLPSPSFQPGMFSAPFPWVWPHTHKRLNDKGVVVGGFVNSAGATHAYRFDSRTGAWQDLGEPLGASLNAATGINASGHIIGMGGLTGGGEVAFLLKNGVAIQLAPLPGDAILFPGQINNLGEVIGQSRGGAPRGVIWHDENGNNASDAGELVELTSVIPATSGWTDLVPNAINDAGQIVGTGSWGFVAFLMTPAGVVITTAELPDGVAGQAYNASLSARFGTAPLTWTLAAPSPPLPPGLSLSSSGVISGTPSVAGTFSVTVEVEDASAPAARDSRNFTLRVLPLSLSGSGTATIDGDLAPGEWDGAGCEDLAVNVPGGGTVPARLCAMNDAQNLYVSLRFERSVPGDGSSLAVEFDNDNDGVAENGDDGFLFNSYGWSVDLFRSNAPPCPPGVPEAWCSFLDTDDGGSSDGAGALTSNGTFTVYELAHPLNSGDGRDVALAAGDAVGFFAFLRILAAGGQYPQDYGDTDFPGVRNYGRIVIRP